MDYTISFTTQVNGTVTLWIGCWPFDLPDWAEYVSVDANRSVWAYNRKPEIYNESWWDVAPREDGKAAMVGKAPEYFTDFENSCTQIPTDIICRADVESQAAMLNALQDEIHADNVKAGWWREDSNLAEKLCLIHSEVSEAMEGLRKDLMDDHLPHRKMMEVELTDAVIRILDLAGRMGYKIGDALMEKRAYNAQRADHKLENRAKDGGKKF